MKPSLKPLGELVHGRRSGGHGDALAFGAAAAEREAMGAVLDQAYHRRESRSLNRIGQATEELAGLAYPRARPKNLACKLAHPRLGCGAAGHHHACAQPLHEPGRIHIAHHELKNLRRALMDNVREQFSRNLPVALRHSAGKFDDLAVVDHRLVRAAVRLLQSFCIGL